MPFWPLLATPFLTWVLLLGSILLLLAWAELLARKTQLRAGSTRQLVHGAVGAVMLLTPFLFRGPFFPLLTGVLFAAINLLALRRGQLQALHGIRRDSYGTVAYPLAYTLLVALFWHRDPVALMVGLLVLAIADPLAAVIGQRYGRTTFTLWHDPKTLAGSMTMLAASALLVLAGLLVLVPLAGAPALEWPQLLMAALPGAALATVAEAQSKRGSDNLSVPLSVGLFVALLRLLPSDAWLAVAVWAGGSALLLALATRMRALDLSGALTAWALGLLVFAAGGWDWVLPLVAFFGLSSALTRLRYSAVPASPRPHAGRRNLVQVTANGGVPLALALAYGLWQVEALYLLFLAALAAATADTWATEIGGWLGGQPRDIVTRQYVDLGASGGLTLAGTAGSLAGAGTLGAVGIVLQPAVVAVADGVALTLIGFTAALLDSLLGATLQVRYLNPGTGAVVEELAAAGEDAAVHSGWRWLDNDAVNLACTASGAVLGLLWVLA
ncbi:MAG: DUF92 domain-containing protein [Candidatus Marinimicrobia bacterium]|nr:DUF92 domain-containing protein [Candidatus Neomarinimicrobiota bacterium]